MVSVASSVVSTRRSNDTRRLKTEPVSDDRNGCGDSLFVNIAEPPRHTRLVDATQMTGAQRLVEQGWDVCGSYLDGYYGDPTAEARSEFAAEVERAVALLPERCVLLTAGIPLQQRDSLRLVCHNAAIKGMGAVPIPYWFEDQSHSVPFANRRHFAAFQGAVASNSPLRAAVVERLSNRTRARSG